MSQTTSARRAAARSGVPALLEQFRGWLARSANSRWGSVVSVILAAVTGSGWALCLIVLFSLILVWQLGWVEAGVVAIVGAVCLLVGVISVLGRFWYRVEIHLPNDRIQIGHTAMGELRVRNTRRRRVRAGVIELPVGSSAAHFLVPSLAAEAEWSEVFAVPARRRGVVELGPARSVRGDAIGLFRTVQRWAEPVRLLIHPAVVRVPFDATGFAADVEGVTTARLSSSDVSFHALRDYAPGDDRRHVHWPTTARLGRLVVRQFEETRRSHHLIVLDTRTGIWQPDSFETAISAAASLALAGIATGGRVSFATSQGWITTTSSVRLLDALTELETDSGPDLVERVRRVVTSRPGISVLTVVCSDQTPEADLSRLATLAGLDVDTGVVRVAAASPPARRTLGRTRVVDCPSLSDLPRLVQRRVV